MKIVELTEALLPKEYNTIVSHPLQSWEWGEARKKTGLTVLRFGEYEKDQLIQIYQMTIHPIPHTSFAIGYIPRSNYPSTEFLQFMKKFGKTHNLIFIKFEPNTFKSETLHVTRYTLHETKTSPHPLFPSWTQLLDISKSEEELLKGMKSKTRYNIKLAQKKGVIVKEMSNEEGFKIFSNLYFETCKRQKYFGHNQNYHRIVWENLKINTAHILIAFYNDVPIAAYELFYFKNKLYYTYGGTSLEYKNVMAANLLMWETIKLGKKLGARDLDMWGSLPPNYDESHDWAGFTRFKEGYGTEFVEFCESFDLICNPILYRVYNLVYVIRQLLLRF